MSFIESYERQLVEAAERRRDARPGRRLRRWLAGGRGRRPGAAVALAALAVGVPAATATVAGWNPFDDPDRSTRVGRPSISQRPVDPALAARLGVLRRPQGAADRGTATSDRLRAIGAQYRGAQLDGVRLLDRDRGAVLVPFDQAPVPRDPGGRPLPGFGGAADGPGVCVFEGTADGFGAGGCHDAAKIDRGLALGSGGGEVSGLVPDGVARVRLIRAGDAVEATVRDNYFAAESASPRVVEWLAADGSILDRIDLNAERSR
jgi:hypothetical protein